MGKLIDRPATAPAAVPSLREGDRLTAAEFLRRYEADADVTRAELIGGVVYVNARKSGDVSPDQDMSPISNVFHSTPQFRLTGLLAVYAVSTPGVDGGGPTTIHIGGANLPEPDAHLRLLAECGGASDNTPDGYLAGPPELLIEVANTSVGRDMGPKYDAYQTAEVAEYLVWRTAHREVLLFAHRRGAYRPVTPVEGILHSLAFPGLWIDAAAMVAGDFPTTMATLQLGLASPEHAAFVAKLAARAKRKRK